MKTRLLLSAVFALLIGLASAHAELPQLKTSDLIFQTNESAQSYAVMMATKSAYSHVGLIEIDGSKTFVLEAVSPVSRTPLEKWIKRGRGSWFAVYRYPGLTPQTQNAIASHAKLYLGRGYDIFFTRHNEEIYCSELVDLAFRSVGLEVGRVQKVKDLNVDDRLVRSLIAKRWERHPLCQTPGMTFEECWNRILNDELVTPVSLTRDSRLKKIWSNYPLNGRLAFDRALSQALAPGPVAGPVPAPKR